MTELPTWAIWLAVFALPILTLLGVLIGHMISRRNAVEAGQISRQNALEAERRGTREELMRQLRWAVDHIASGDPTRAQVGVDQLGALLDSRLLTDDDKVFIEAALRSAIATPLAEVEEALSAGQDIIVVQITPEAAASLIAAESVEVSGLDAVRDNDAQERREAAADGSDGADHRGGDVHEETDD